MHKPKLICSEDGNTVLVGMVFRLMLLMCVLVGHVEGALAGRTVPAVSTVSILPQGPVETGQVSDEGEVMPRESENTKGVAPRWVIYNLDCSAFFVGTLGAAVPETLDTWVDHHAALGITDLFINVNAQRTNYRSDVWESDWDGYDPNLGVDQPFFAGIKPERRFEAQMYMNALSLHEQGCDYPKHMIDRARLNHVKPWISLRMNDGHYPDWPDHPYHSTFWKEHPQWRLNTGWDGMDYEQAEVREHYIKLVKEVCDRYDIDGLELDFLRFSRYLRPGREHEGGKLIDAFVKEIRDITQACSERLGHPVKLAVRVPTTPWIARRHGLDAVSWATSGLVDMIIASPFWDSTCSDIPIEIWKGLLCGADVSIALAVEDAVNSGASGRRTANHEELRGVFVSGLQRGADAVYFFNLFTGPYQFWPRQVHDQLLRDSGSCAALRAGPRRHIVTITSPWAKGESGQANPLPYTGTNAAFRIHIGPMPLARQCAYVELDTSDNDKPMDDVTVNGIPCPRSSGGRSDRQVYDIPAHALGEGYNLVAINSKEDFTLEWVEISIR